MTKANSSPSPQSYEQKKGDLTETVRQNGVSPDKTSISLYVSMVWLTLSYGCKMFFYQ